MTTHPFSVRRARAKAEGRLGELEGIDLPLTFVAGKRDGANRLSRREPISIGLPTLRPTSEAEKWP